MRTFITVLAAACTLAYATPRITDCGSLATIDFQNVFITGCNNPGRNCIFTKGQDASMSLPFTPSTQVQTLNAKVTGILGKVIPIPFPINPENACIQSGLTCPLQANQKKYLHSDTPSFEFLSISVSECEVGATGREQQQCRVPPVPCAYSIDTDIKTFLNHTF
uniref:Ecdysteroid-regulated 16 kDa protein n=1 Tax=Procambarus clarkii TaxID=6728 RepID=A0A1C6ZZ31_PROCL|nr:ecdysteroid-regulated 16 kDa protein [Procambarus clarkii]